MDFFLLPPRGNGKGIGMGIPLPALTGVFVIVFVFVFVCVSGNVFVFVFVFVFAGLIFFTSPALPNWPGSVGIFVLPFGASNLSSTREYPPCFGSVASCLP